MEVSRQTVSSRVRVRFRCFSYENSRRSFFRYWAGFALAASWAGVETVAFAEIDSYASRVIERHFPRVRNYGRVQDVPAIGGVWLVTGGVPCQPASVAGKRRGTEDDRWLWPEALAAVERVRPACIRRSLTLLEWATIQHRSRRCFALTAAAGIKRMIEAENL